MIGNCLSCSRQPFSRLRVCCGFGRHFSKGSFFASSSFSPANSTLLPSKGTLSGAPTAREELMMGSGNDSPAVS